MVYSPRSLRQCFSSPTCDMLNHIFVSSGMGGVHGYHAPPRAYDEYLKAYSVAMLPGRERTNVSFGGKSALAHLSYGKMIPRLICPQLLCHPLL